MPVPPDLVPELPIGVEDLLVVATQQERPQLVGIVFIGDPLDLVALGRVADSMAVRT
jgi:hypothetical protein